MPSFFEGFGEDLALFQPDRIHPTAAAQPQLLDNVWPALQPLLATGAMSDAARPRRDNASASTRCRASPTRIDVRSPSEFADDHIPGAINLPGARRRRARRSRHAARAGVGVRREEASARRWSRATSPRSSRRIAATSRATGRRSSTAGAAASAAGSLAHVLNEIGWRAVQLEGGYRAYRRHVVAQLATLPPRFRYRVVCGLTGSGKSRLLARARTPKARRCSTSRSSRSIAARCWATCPTQPQPSQKAFDSQLARRARALRSGASGLSSNRRAARSAPCRCRTRCSPRCAPRACVRVELADAVAGRAAQGGVRALPRRSRTRSRSASRPRPAARQEHVERWNAQAQRGDVRRARRRAARRALRSDVRALDRAQLSALRATRSSRAPDGIDAAAFRRACARARRTSSTRSTAMTDYAFRIVNVFAESPARRQSAVRVRGRDAASTTRRCRRSRCSSTCPRRRSSCRPSARRRACASSRRRSRCRSPATRRSAPRTSCARSRGAGDRVTLEMKAGVIPVEARRRRVDAARPMRRSIAAPAAHATSSPRCSASHADESSSRPLWVDTGTEQLVIPLASFDAVRRAAPKPDLMLRIAAATKRAHGLRFRTRRGQRALPLLLPEARRGDRGPGHRLRVREPRRLAARDRRVASAAADASTRARRSAGPAGWVSRSTVDRAIRVSGRVIELAPRHAYALGEVLLRHRGRAVTDRYKWRVQRVNSGAE